MTVQENAPLGTLVGRVKAIDGDQGSNAASVYTITHANIGSVYVLYKTHFLVVLTI